MWLLPAPHSKRILILCEEELLLALFRSRRPLRVEGSLLLAVHLIQQTRSAYPQTGPAPHADSERKEKQPFFLRNSALQTQRDSNTTLSELNRRLLSAYGLPDWMQRLFVTYFLISRLMAMTKLVVCANFHLGRTGDCYVNT